MVVALDTLSGNEVLKSHATDVERTRERARRRRLVRLAVVLGLVAGYMWWRIWASGSPWPHMALPASWAPMLPALVLVVLLGAVLVAPLVLAGRSPHVLFRPEDCTVRLSDVKGMDGVVEEVIQTLNIFRAHRSFNREMGGSPRRGVLFEGPPGTGKTFMAKAMAAEAGVPFLFVSSSAFQSMYYGQTNRRIRAYFRVLRKVARSEGGAIGFIEEIDAIGASRAGMRGPGAEGVAGVVNELLIQMQSFDAPSGWLALRRSFTEALNRFLSPSARLGLAGEEVANVLIVGATNRASDLDPALLRPGRFDRSIHFAPPARAGRRQILDFYLERKSHDETLDDDKVLDELASETLGYTPVMIERLLDEGLVWAIRRGSKRMGLGDLKRARLTQELGLAQPVEYAPTERARIASHEAGHALLAWVRGEGRRLEFLSIVKRGDALGLAAHSDKEERFTQTASELEALIVIAMGGLVAEEMLFGEPSTGVAGDLAAATSWAAQMVGTFGMAGTLVSYSALAPREGIVAAVAATDEGRRAMEQLLGRAKAEAKGHLEGHRRALEALRDELLEREEMTGDEVVRILEACQVGPGRTKTLPMGA